MEKETIASIILDINKGMDKLNELLGEKKEVAEEEEEEEEGNISNCNHCGEECHPALNVCGDCSGNK